MLGWAKGILGQRQPRTFNEKTKKDNNVMFLKVYSYYLTTSPGS